MGILQEMTSTYNMFIRVGIQFFQDRVLLFLIILK